MALSRASLYWRGLYSCNSLLSIESWTTLRARGSHRGTVVISELLPCVPLSWTQSGVLCLSY